MTNIYVIIIEYLENGRKGVLATVVRKKGAAPRDVGTKMFVGEDGKTFGTIGGGRVEAEAYREALQMMNVDRTRVLSIYTETQTTANMDLMCGGDLEVLLEPVTVRHLHVYREIENFMKTRRRGIVVTSFHDGLLAKTLVESNWSTIGDALRPEALRLPQNIFHEKKPVLVDEILADPIRITFPLYLFGAGHVSQAVSKIAKLADFEVTVVDDREELANSERFPDATVIIVGGLHEAVTCLDFSDNEYVVIVTRSHEQDAAVLERVLQRPTRYIGMIGSRRKAAAILNDMRKKGFDEKDLERIHTPIGIPIDAETPEEIGVSIVAELIAERNAKHAITLK
jgi:xanthine dehydrogenase accessory factor